MNESLPGDQAPFPVGGRFYPDDKKVVHYGDYVAGPGDGLGDHGIGGEDFVAGETRIFNVSPGGEVSDVATQYQSPAPHEERATTPTQHAAQQKKTFTIATDIVAGPGIEDGAKPANPSSEQTMRIGGIAAGRVIGGSRMDILRQAEENWR